VDKSVDNLCITFSWKIYPQKKFGILYLPAKPVSHIVEHHKI
jgi:hypothetical protein